VLLRSGSSRCVRLIRSKGVGVYFVTRNPWTCRKGAGATGQSRAACAARVFPRTRKPSRRLPRPCARIPVQRRAGDHRAAGGRSADFVFWTTRAGQYSGTRICSAAEFAHRPLTDGERQALIKASVLHGHYENAIDRESAYEKLRARASEKPRRRRLRRSSLRRGRRHGRSGVDPDGFHGRAADARPDSWNPRQERGSDGRIADRSAKSCAACWRDSGGGRRR